jgi:signal transduction histidine kinase
VLAIVSLEVPLALNLKERVDSEVHSQARSQADVVAATASDLLRASQRRDLARLAVSSARSVRGRVVIVNGRGRLVADSGGRGALGAGYATRPEIAAALRGRSVQTERRSRTLGADILATAVPLVSRGKPVGAVRITQGVSAVGRAVRRAETGLALIGGVVLLLGLAAGTLIARGMARPLRRLEATAGLVAGGELSARAPLAGSTEQRSLARSFNEMTERLGRMLKSQSDFVADASHQLRTPLTGLRLRIEEARVAGVSPAADRELWQGMRELDRLALFIDELLVLSRAGERDRAGEPTDLAAAAARAGERWRSAAGERGLALEVRRNGPASAVCSTADLDRALDSLVENAILYSPAGSKVEIVAAGGRIEVLDRGAGLAPNEEHKVFERFRRGHAGRAGPPGTGLGLAIAAELVSCWEGSATISNRPGGGARAVISFPPDGEPS